MPSSLAAQSRIWTVFTALLPYAALIFIFGGMGARDLFNSWNVDAHGLNAQGRLPVYFFNALNLEGLALNCAAAIVAAAGMTLVILVGGIDLSVGSILGVASVVACLGANATRNIPLGMALGVGAGMLCGLFNGSLTIGLRVPSFIVTLGTLMSLRGVCRLLNGDSASVYIGGNIADKSAASAFRGAFNWLAAGKFPILKISPSVPLAAACVATLAVVLNYTRFGRRIYAVGSNEEAARLSGVRVGWTQLYAYVIAGLMAGIAGVMEASRSNGSFADTGFGQELVVISAVVIGGASLSGGRGTVSGCVVGALMMTALKTACTFLHVPDAVQYVIIGLFLIAAAAVDSLRQRKTG